MGFAKWFDEQSKGIRILLLVPIWGGIIGLIYRIFKYIETKHTATLVGGILEIVPIVGFIIALLDFIFMIVDNKFKFFVPEGEKIVRAILKALSKKKKLKKHLLKKIKKKKQNNIKAIYICISFFCFIFIILCYNIIV